MVFHYTIRAFIPGRDQRIDGICRVFCSMERSAYNLLREGIKVPAIKSILRNRYGVTNARWVEYAVSQAGALVESQEGNIRFQRNMLQQKMENTLRRIRTLRSLRKIEGCQGKITRLRTKVDTLTEQLSNRSCPKAVFGSRKLLHDLAVARGEVRKAQLAAEWRNRRSNHFLSTGQASPKGNANTRLVETKVDNDFKVEIRNWPDEDFTKSLYVPERWTGLLSGLIRAAESVKRKPARLRSPGEEGISYSVRVVRRRTGYQVLISFSADEPFVGWNGRVGGIDINPEGFGCTVVSNDGNLIATRFVREPRLITALSNKRKWFLEYSINRLLRWCKDTWQCNAVALENLHFKGTYDSSRRSNFILSNFMRRRMIGRIRLKALRMGMILVSVESPYSSMVAMAKYGARFGGYNRHELAAFVIGRRAIGFGEIPAKTHSPITTREKMMWDHCASFYGHQPLIPTLSSREPMERRSDRNVKGREMMTKLLTAPPA